LPLPLEAFEVSPLARAIGEALRRPTPGGIESPPGDASVEATEARGGRPTGEP
jgi:hypothetical protein